jgi:hypothetical protein
MPSLHRHTLVVAVLAVAFGTAAAANAVAPEGGLPTGDDGPRNLRAEAATGDTEAMRSVVQEIVTCLRAQGFHPGDAEIRGPNVVIAGWNPDMDSVAGRADQECAFPPGTQAP